MIAIEIPTGAAHNLKQITALLGRRRELSPVLDRLARESTEAAAALSQKRTELDAIEGDLAVAEAMDEDKGIRAHGASRDRLRREIGQSEEVIMRSGRAKLGVAARQQSIEPEIEKALPALQSSLREIHDAAMSALRTAMWRGISGQGSLIEAMAAAVMLNDTLGVPGRNFLDQIRIPDPLFPVVELPMFGGAGGFRPPGDDVHATWLGRIKLGSVLADNGEAAPGAAAAEIDWRRDPELVGQAEKLMAYVVACRQAEAIVTRLRDRRAREEFEQQERERRAEIAKLPSYAGDLSRGLRHTQVIR